MAGAVDPDVRPRTAETDPYRWGPVSLVDTLFSLPEATLLAGIVQHFEGLGERCLGIIQPSLMISGHVLMKLADNTLRAI